MSLVEPNYIQDLLEHDEECIGETSDVHFLTSGSPDVDDIYGDPLIPPRLGDGYQVEIPSLLIESERLQLRHSPINIGNMLGASYSFGVRLTIPIMWVHHVDDFTKHEQKEFCGTPVGTDIDNKESLIYSKGLLVSGYSSVSSSNHNTAPQGLTCKVELPNEPLNHGEEFARSTHQRMFTVYDQTDMGLPWLQLKKSEGYIPLPGSPVASWSYAESLSFLLGLYIFGKNLVLVRKFMGSKEMGEMLSFYYGKFYRSDAHRRWSECRKIRSRRCIHGQRIFTGWRRQELLSRVLPRIAKEVQDNLLEAVKSFSEGRASLEEFVFTLKAMVGMKLLVEAVGIGKGKHDLTGIVLDPIRSNQVIPLRPEIPVGKACSSLASADIIKFLTGDFRLSKARSNDLFWEAVWPRLLARGWHSEQPKDLRYVGSKNALVFLIPGINKFSRRKLTKGNQYFDSVRDVLNKVASNPRLLEFEVEAANETGICKDGYGLDANTKLDDSHQSDNQRRCYLSPRLPICNSELVRFTVVDTSSFQGEAQFNVRELRSLPVDATSSYDPSNQSEGMDTDSSVELPNSDILLNDQEKSEPGISDDKNIKSGKKCRLGKGVQSDPSDYLDSVSKRRLAIDGHDSNDRCCDSLNNKKFVKDTKCHYSRRMKKSGQPKYLAPVSKRQKLNSSKYAGFDRCSNSSRDHLLKKEEPRCDQKSLEVIEFSSGNGSINISAVAEAVLSHEKPQSFTLIDLNLPQLPPEFDTDEPFCSEMADNQDGSNPKGSSHPSEKDQQFDNRKRFDASNEAPSMQQTTTSTRRQSTRNRPPTTRALESLACGFLSTKRKWRGVTEHPSGNSASRPTRRARRTVGAPVPAPTTNLAIASPNLLVSNVGLNEDRNEPLVWPESNADHELLGVLYCSEMLG